MSLKTSVNKPHLSDPIYKIPHVGLKTAELFKKLKIRTVKDLFNYVPSRVVDLSNPISVKEALKRESEKVLIYGEILNIKIIKTPRRRIWITSAKIKDKTGQIRVVWFHQPYLKNFFKNKKYVFYGNVEYSPFTKEVTLISPEIFDVPKVVPIYRLTEGLSSKQIQRTIACALDRGYTLNDQLPVDLLKEYKLEKQKNALEDLHFPKSVKSFEKAKERFNFNELLTFILTNLYLKKINQRNSSFKIRTEKKLVDTFISSLPFKLTKDQNFAIHDIISDFKKTYPQSRMIQGDVGSGKTVIAFFATFLAIKSGYKVAYLAPTQILAHQHFESAKKILKPFGIKIGLLTSQTKNSAHSLRGVDLIIGTHAILQKNIKIKDLSLVIIDEQHRFGVEQRAFLMGGKKSPHFLSLSATPIPRTLAHIVFGNVDISLIKTKPEGRLKVKTYLVPANKRSNSYHFIDKLIKDGQQAFVICPLIEEKEVLDEKLFEINESKAVESEIKNLKNTILGRWQIEMLHGKMSSQEKDEKMKKMQSGEIKILVSTSVIEVGIDIACATTMIIESADRFGLSQLHQFRGRVGRSNLQSFCFLFTQDKLNDKSRDRLKTFVRNSDGFKLSEMDLKQRGPGAIFGTTQSGFEGLNPLWFENTKVLENASKAAKKIIDKIENYPDIYKAIKEKISVKHLE